MRDTIKRLRKAGTLDNQLANELTQKLDRWSHPAKSIKAAASTASGSQTQVSPASAPPAPSAAIVQENEKMRAKRDFLAQYGIDDKRFERFNSVSLEELQKGREALLKALPHDGLVDGLIRSNPLLLRLPSTAPAEFAEYARILHEAIPAIVKLIREGKYKPEAFDGLQSITRTILKAREEIERAQLLKKLDTAGYEGETALAILEWGFFFKQALMTGNRGITMHSITENTSKHLAPGKLHYVERQVVKLMNVGAILRPNGHSLNINPTTVSEPAARAALAFVLRKMQV